jgi:hypothetical protein
LGVRLCFLSWDSPSRRPPGQLGHPSLLMK